VVATWQGQATEARPLTDVLEEGKESLRAGEASAVVAGPSGFRGAFVDLDLPRLNAEDLRNALVYELSRRAPVAGEALTWGYRKLPSQNKEQTRVRLVFMREEEWAKCIADLSALGEVDQALPPEAALDPVLRTESVLFPGPGEHDRVALAVDESGRRQILWYPGGNDSGSETDPSGAVPAADLAGLRAGALADLSPDDRIGFSPALVLGLYGLSENLDRDRRTLMHLPYELRPKRNRHNRVIALALSLYLVAVGGFGLWRHYSAAGERLADLELEIEDARKELDAVATRENREEHFAKLRADLLEAGFSRPGLAEILVELTRRIDDTAWLSRLVWDEGVVDFDLKTSSEYDQILRALRDSALLADLQRMRESQRAEETTVQLRVRAAYRTDFTDMGREDTDDLDTDETAEPLTGAEDQGQDPDVEAGEDGETDQEEPEPTVLEETETEAGQDSGAVVIPPPPPPPPPPPGAGQPVTAEEQ
jgi:Tfp pilus assembly protein PilN